jgi:hypothetical protein
MTQVVLPYDHAIVGQERGWDCGPASAQNVLSSRMKVSEADLIRTIGTTTNGTDYVGLIERDLDRRVPDAKYTSVYIPGNSPTPEQTETFWRNLKSSIDARWGVVCNWVSPPSNPPRAIMGSQSPRGYGGHTVYHYVAAMGYDDNYDGKGGRAVWIADSGFQPFGYWITVEQCALLIASKGYAYAAVAPQAAPPPVAPTQDPPNITPPPVLQRISDPRTGTTIIPNSYRPRGLADPLWIAIHTSESRSRARDLLEYCRTHGVSYNTFCDDRDIWVGVEYDDAPWSAAGANKYAFHVVASSSFASWSREAWLDPNPNDGFNEDAQLWNLAKVVAFLSQRNPERIIPVKWIGDGPRPPWGLNGVCGHMDFGGWGGGHTDPGVNFPRQTLITRAQSLLTGGPPVVIAPPPPVAIPGTNPQNYAGWMLYLGNPANDAEKVRAVQNALHRFSYGKALAVDGIFGVATQASVRQYQYKKGLVQDGIVGPMTAAALFSE